MTRLTEIATGKSVVLISVAGGREAEKKIMDLGLIPGERIKVINNSHKGPLTINVKGSRLALGHGLAHKLLVREAL